MFAIRSWSGKPKSARSSWRTRCAWKWSIRFRILHRARASYDAAVETRQLQEEALDAEQQRYQVGASTTYLVIQEQRDLAQARTTEVVTEGNYAKAEGRARSSYRRNSRYLQDFDC